MSEANFIDQLKKIKKLKDENREKVEKIRNIDLENKKKIIKNIVNLEIVQKLMKDNIIYSGKGNGKLVWLEDDGTIITLEDSINEFRRSLE